MCGQQKGQNRAKPCATDSKKKKKQFFWNFQSSVSSRQFREFRDFSAIAENHWPYKLSFSKFFCLVLLLFLFLSITSLHLSFDLPIFRCPHTCTSIFHVLISASSCLSILYNLSEVLSSWSLESGEDSSISS